MTNANKSLNGINTMISIPKKEKPKKKIGKIIRMDADQWDRVKRAAKKNKVSMNWLVICAIEHMMTE